MPEKLHFRANSCPETPEQYFCCEFLGREKRELHYSYNETEESDTKNNYNKSLLTGIKWHFHKIHALFAQ